MTAREACLRALHQVETRQVPIAKALDRSLKAAQLAAPDRALATEVAYGVCRRLNQLDWAMGAYSKRTLDQLTPWIRNILRMAAYQLMYLDRVPEAAVCHEAVELAKKYGQAGTARLVNAVLREFLRSGCDPRLPETGERPALELGLRYAHPTWMVERWLDRYGRDETIRICEANNSTPPVTVRANALRTDPPALEERLRAGGTDARRCRYAPEGLEVTGGIPVLQREEYREGLYYVQGESSMLVVRLLGPSPGEVVIDACSAPGGKATHMAELMGNHGKVLAVDVNEHKLGLVRETGRRLGAHIVATVCADARKLGELFQGKADRLLVDAPCSGLGVLWRRPDAKWSKRPEDISRLGRLQLEILEGSASCLRRGGVLVYSTCTIEPEENQQVVEGFLSRHPEFAVGEIDAALPEPLLQSARTGEGMVQLYTHRHRLDGFFMAVLHRKK